MSLSDLKDHEITSALQPFAIDPKRFDTAVVDKIGKIQKHQTDHPFSLSILALSQSGQEM